MEYLKLLKIMVEIQNTLKLGFRPTQLLLASLVSLFFKNIYFQYDFEYFILKFLSYTKFLILYFFSSRNRRFCQSRKIRLSDCSSDLVKKFHANFKLWS